MPFLGVLAWHEVDARRGQRLTQQLLYNSRRLLAWLMQWNWGL